jgi:dipeptidase
VSYAVYVGAGLTRDGCAYLAGYGDEPSSHWLELAPRREHPPGALIEVGVSPQSAMPGIRSTIPQVPVTARHLRVDYSHYLGVPAPLTNGGLNEHGVAVRDVWSPSGERLRAMTPPDQDGPNYSDLARIVLERARTAREGVEVIGRLIDEHGEATYGGNSHLIADAGEAWVVIEFAGGQKLWVAERVGRDAIRVSRPGVIQQVPAGFAEHPDFAGAPHLIEFAIDRGWYDPASGPFDVNAVYGDGKGVWQGARWVAGELAGRAARPERIGDSAGYGQVVPLAAESHPDLRLIWHAPVGAIAAPFTPIFLGADAVAPELRRHRYLTAGEHAAFMDSSRGDTASTVPQRVEATRSAVVTFKRLLYLLAEHHELFLPEVTPVWEALEHAAATRLATVVEQAQLLIGAGRAELARDLLTGFGQVEAVRALELGEAMVDSMDQRSQVLFGIRDEPGWRGPEQLW